MVVEFIYKIFKVIGLLGLVMIIWTLVIGNDGLTGQSFVKENVWNGINTYYSQQIMEKTENYGYGTTARLQSVWDSVVAPEITDL